MRDPGVAETANHSRTAFLLSSILFYSTLFIHRFSKDSLSYRFTINNDAVFEGLHLELS